MKSHAGNRHLLIPTGKRIALLFADPLGQTIWIFIVCWMFFIQWKIIKFWPAAISETGGIDAGCLTNAMDAYFNCSTQRIVTSYNIVVMHYMIRKLPWRGNSSHVDQCLTSSKSVFHCGVVNDVGLDIGGIRSLQISPAYRAHRENEQRRFSSACQICESHRASRLSSA